MASPEPHVISVNVSPGGIPKSPVAEARVDMAGIDGDGHHHEKHNTPLQALSLLDVEDLDDLAREGFGVRPGATGENVTCRGLDVDALSVGDRLRFSGGLVIEITKRRNPCYVLDAIDPALKAAARGRIGFYARIIEPGALRCGEAIAVERAANVPR